MKQRSITVMIVDDLKMVRETWKMILGKHEQIDVIGECASGAEAIEAACILKPHIILMDINMTPVNGFEATRKISHMCPEVNIIGVSINTQAGYARNMMQLGAKGFVTKNSHQQEVIDAIFAVSKGGTYLCKEIKEQMGGFPN
jgi:two-component system, NarL family, invasion response regulator UvrY